MDIQEVKKCGVFLKYGIGTYSKNPEECKDASEEMCYTWIWYDKVWYRCLTSKAVGISDILYHCYSKEQVLEKLIDMI